LTATVALLIAASIVATAQSAPGMPRTLPNTTIAPATGEASTTPPVGDTEGPDITAPPPEEVPAPASVKRPHHHVHVHNTVPLKPVTYKGPVETGQAMLKVTSNGWAYALPSTSANKLERMQPGKFVDVTGTTAHYVRVRLKSGATAYVPMSTIELARPTDKIFRLTHDTPVLARPNHASQRLAEVHNGHDVHAIGMSVNYLKIRMKDGLEGFITTTALE
jgi:hypothetical protein